MCERCGLNLIDPIENAVYQHDCHQEQIDTLRRRLEDIEKRLRREDELRSELRERGF